MTDILIPGDTGVICINHDSSFSPQSIVTQRRYFPSQSVEHTNF